MTNTHETTVTLPAKSMTLKQDDLLKLCEILEKAIEYDPQGYLHFTLSGKNESMSFKSIESLRNARLPEEVNHVSLAVESDKEDRTIRLVSDNKVPYTKVEITGTDADWVAARSKEIEEFISDHHNFHWIFNRIWLPALQGILLVGLLLYAFTQPFWQNKLFLPVAIVAGVILVLVYIWGISKLFPFTFIDTGRPSTMATFRTVIKYAAPLIIVTIIVSLTMQLIAK